MPDHFPCPKCGRRLAKSGEVVVDGKACPVFQCDECLKTVEMFGAPFEVALTFAVDEDVIYSVGYFDYLPDDFLAKLLHSLHQLLNPGGKLIAAFKDASRYRSQE